MLREHTLNGVTWIDLEQPTREEVLALVESYRLPLACAEELLYPSIRSKVDAYPEILYLVLHFPDDMSNMGAVLEREVDFVVGKDFLITAHYGSHETIDRFAKTFDVRSVLHETDQKIHGGHLTFWVLQALYQTLFEELESIAKRIRFIEQGIFNGEESKMVRELSNTNRLLLDLKQPLGFHREILRSFEQQSLELFGNAFLSYGHLLLGEQYRVEWMLESARDTLRDLRDTNDSLLTTKNNQVMQKLSVLSFVMLPLFLLATIFNMPVEMPFLESPAAFWIIIGAMGAGVLSLYFYFKRRKWL